MPQSVESITFSASPRRGFYKALLEDRYFRVSFVLFVLFLLWWLALCLTNASSAQYKVWGYVYQITALFGAIVGLVISSKWSGLKSTIGRALLMFSTGLLFEWFAQAAGSFLTWQTGTVPYPSLSDVGAFGAMIFYAIGAIFLAKVSGARVSLRSSLSKIIAVIIPLSLLGFSYSIFLSRYQFDWSEPLTTFLDIGYPLGAAFYVSMAILAYLLTRKLLGGLLRVPISFFIASLLAEYVADFSFLYNAHSGAYVAGGYNDLMFMGAYSLMAISLIQLGVVYRLITKPT